MTSDMTARNWLITGVIADWFADRLGTNFFAWHFCISGTA
jgi:hypothetical protein